MIQFKVIIIPNSQGSEECLALVSLFWPCNTVVAKIVDLQPHTVLRYTGYVYMRRYIPPIFGMNAHSE